MPVPAVSIMVTVEVTRAEYASEVFEALTTAVNTHQGLVSIADVSMSYTIDNSARAGEPTIKVQETPYVSPVAATDEAWDDPTDAI